MSFLDDAISTVGRGLAQTAAKSLSDATGFDVGGTLNVLFGDQQTTGGENLTALAAALPADWTGTPEQLILLQKGVDQQTQMISDLGNQLSALAASIATITGEIANLEQMLEKIGQQQLYQEWQTIDADITPFLASIETGYSTYGEYIADFATTQTSLVTILADNIINTNDGPRVGLTAINKYIVDDGQAKGVLQLWSNMVVPLVAAGTLDYRDAVDQYMAYYQKLAYAQLQATNLVMEAYTLQGDAGEPKKVWDQYRAHLLSQEDVFISWLVPLVVAGVQGGMMQANTTYFAFTCADASLQLNPGLQRAPASQGDPSQAYYSPSRVFKAAESLLASLYVTDDADRRIAVHMLFESGGEVSGLLSGVNLTLSPTDGGDPVSATRSVRLGAPFTYLSSDMSASPDLNLYLSSFYIKRFIFSASDTNDALADDSYTITNINGSDGLVAMDTYLSSNGNPKPSFMNDNVLGYSVGVNETSPFDFLNFMAYMTPVRGPCETS